MNSNKELELAQAVERIRETINQVIERNNTKATHVNKEESLRYLYAVEMAQYILKALDGDQ